MKTDLADFLFNNTSCILRVAAYAARTRIRMAPEKHEEEEQVSGEWRHWFSRTREPVSSYRMQRESDVCESVCEAGVLVHGCRRCRCCRACHLCGCALCVCVCVCVFARDHQQRARAQQNLILTPLARGQCYGGHRYQVLRQPQLRALSLPLPLSLCLPVCLPFQCVVPNTLSVCLSVCLSLSLCLFLSPPSPSHPSPHLCESCAPNPRAGYIRFEYMLVYTLARMHTSMHARVHVTRCYIGPSPTPRRSTAEADAADDPLRTGGEEVVVGKEEATEEEQEGEERWRSVSVSGGTGGGGDLEEGG